MSKIKFHTPQTELLFILGSTRDTKGRRVLVRCEGVENTVYPDDLGDRDILSLIGIDGKELELITGFFEKGKKR